MILILRGHIRDSFQNDDLYDLIRNIYFHNRDLKIYIHTWNIFTSNLSWRKLDENNNIVTEEVIKNYFKIFSRLIKHIIIEDDKKIKIRGNTIGGICRSSAPLLGWKNYWYGKNSIIKYLKNSNSENIENEIIVNTRFDVLNNSCSIDKQEIINFINNSKKLIEIKKNVFLKKKFFCGIDNIYIGTIDTQYKLVNHFHNNLDYITTIYRYKNIANQEKLVELENDRLFT